MRHLIALVNVGLWRAGRPDVPSSVCWRASSATASPTLPLTEASASLARHCSSFARMASRSAGWRVRNRSAVWPEGVLRGLDDWRLKMTAAKVRVCCSASAWRRGGGGAAHPRQSGIPTCPGPALSAPRGP